MNMSHGDSKARLYRIYKGMKQRCYNNNHPQFKDYGGRGVVMCNEWKYSYPSFKKWALENGYKNTLEIDKDKLSMENGVNPPIYSPSTCIWATRAEQSKFKRDPIKLGYFCRISADDASELCEAYATGMFTQKEIAVFYNMERTAISRILSGKTKQFI